MNFVHSIRLSIRHVLAAMTLCFAAAAPALATPETIINVDEQTVGVSETHLFVLRVSTDNLGYYEASRIEVHLIATAWDTGDEEAFLIDRFVKSADYGEDGEYQGYSIKRDAGILPGSPHQIMQSRGAVPWLAAYRAQSATWGPTITAAPDEISVQFGDNPPHVITRTALQAQLDRLRVFLVDNSADHPRSITMTTRQLYEGRRVSAANCRPAQLLEFSVPGPSRKPILMRVICAVDEDGERTSLVVQLRPVEGEAP